MIEALTRVLVHVAGIGIAADLCLDECVTSQKEIYSAVAMILGLFRGLDAHK